MLLMSPGEDNPISKDEHNSRDERQHQTGDKKVETESMSINVKSFFKKHLSPQKIKKVFDHPIFEDYDDEYDADEHNKAGEYMDMLIQKKIDKREQRTPSQILRDYLLEQDFGTRFEVNDGTDLDFECLEELHKALQKMM